MKVRLEIDDSLNEDEIVIHTKEYTEELKQLLSNFKSKPSIQFFKQDTEYYLDLDTILFFESDNGRVYAHTANDMFSTTQKLYELENILPNSWYIVIDPSNWSSTIYFSFLSTFNNRG